MNQTQLMLNFGRRLMRRLRLVKTVEPIEPAPAARHPGGLRRDAILEQFCRKLLLDAGCDLEVGVFWNNRLRTTAGLACWQKKTISLNPRLLEISSAEVQRTVRHELAHFLAQHRAGRRRIPAHGAEWRQACRDLGIPNESRCHDLPFKRRRMERKFFYACPECNTLLSRVHPLRKRVACLRCCRKHNGGKYHERFRFLQIEPPDRLAA